MLQHKTSSLIYLSLFHILVIASSNYLVQFAFTWQGLNFTYGAFTFPLIFLATDLTVRIFGRQLARKIIFFAMFPALIISYVFSVIFAEGNYLGMDQLAQFSMFAFRIALASFMAYALGQLADIFVFDKIRQRVKNWWLAPLTSSIFGGILDTLSFFFIAFYQSEDPFMAEHWLDLAAVDYSFKMLVSCVFFIPAYGILVKLIVTWLTRKDNSKPAV